MVRFIAAIVTIVLWVSPAFAQPPLPDVIDKVEEAYGGKKFVSLKSISIESNRRLSYPGTNYSPDFNEFVEDRYHFQIDLAEQRGSTERHVRQNGNVYHDRNVTVGDGLAQISYALNRVVYDEDFDFYNRFGTVFRISDTLLAYQLVTHPERAKVVGPASYRGRPYHKIDITLPGSDAPLTLSIDAQTGLIMQMTRTVGDNEIIYLFRNHAAKKGIGYARENQVFLNGELFDYEFGRKISINKVRNSVFKVEPKLDVYTPPSSEEIDILEISTDIHHVGRGINFTTFIQADGYVMAYGGNDDFQQRYETYRKNQPGSGPLRYLVVSHDHEFGRSGVKEALELGAQIVTSDKIKDIALEAIGENASSKLRTVRSGERIGAATFYDFETSHTNVMLVAYLAADKIMLEEDHYRPVFEGVPGHLFDASVNLVNRIDALGLDVDYLVSGHGDKVEDWANLQSVAASQKAVSCYYNRPICRGDW